MTKYLKILALSLSLAACTSPDTCSFDGDPLCTQAVERACSGDPIDFEAHLRSLSSRDRAQIVAQSERLHSCNVGDWFDKIVEDAYATHGDAFYDDSQPWIESRAIRAIKDIKDNSKFSNNAAHYLHKHLNNGISNSLLAKNIDILRNHATNDDVFAILAKIGDASVLAQLCELEPTPQRDKYLIVRWPELPEDARRRAIAAYVSAKWSMQTSGSSQLPQYLVLDWAKFALPDAGDIPDFVVSVDVESVKIRNDEVKRGNWHATSSFQMPALRAQGGRHARLDLGRWLKDADNYRISTKAQVVVWPLDVSDECLSDRNTCPNPPLAQWDANFDRTYRVFAAAHTGAPNRTKGNEPNREFIDSLVVDLCNDKKCLTIFDKKPINTNEILEIEQGRDFYISASYSNARYPMASRLMARSGEGKAWREIATFYGDAPISYDMPIRGNVSLGSLCNAIGPCKLSLQIRPSLRMARRDPRITRYFGANIDLSPITFDVKNVTPEQRWQ